MIRAVSAAVHRLRAIRPARGIAVSLAGIALVAVTAGTISAFWTVTSGASPHTARAVADALPQGATPGTPTTAAPNGRTATVTFAQVTTTSGSVALTNYRLVRYQQGASVAIPVTAPCSIAGGVVSCAETALPDGRWQYANTPTLGTNWVGGESARSGVVVIDGTVPTVSVTQPAANGTYTNAQWPASISGIVADATSGIAGASSIRLAITQSSTGRTWNGTSFAAGANTVPASSYNPATGVWAYTFTATSFPAAGTYTVLARATDAATNFADSSTITFTIVRAIAQVQRTSATSATAAVSATYATQPRQGNLLVAIVSSPTNLAIPTLTSAGWTVATSNVSVAAPQAIYYKIAGLNEPSAVSASNVLGALNIDIQIYEYSGIASTSPLGGTATGTAGTNVAGNGGTFTCGSVTATQANNLAIAGLVHARSTDTGANVNTAWTGSFTEQNDVNANSALIASAHRIVTSTGSYATGSNLQGGTAAGAARCQTVIFRGAS
jgi:hypothetical protein